MHREKPWHYVFSVAAAVIVGCSTAALLFSSGAYVYKRIAGPSEDDPEEIQALNAPDDLEYLAEILPPSLYTVSDSVIQNMSISTTTELALTARAYFVKDLDDHKVLFSKNEDLALPIASVTKLVTAFVALEKMNLTDKIKITNEAILTYGTSGSLRSGETLTLSQILHPLLMESSNDAAEAIARAYGRDAFIEEMNHKVVELGAKHTSFTDPSGLTPLNVSTASDLALIADRIYDSNKKIYDITHTKTYRSAGHVWNSPNVLLTLKSFIGGKNGFTDEAHLTTVSLFQWGSSHLKGKRIVVVFLIARRTWQLF
jgi:D-alanyl-D-alanine carboxypeptidase (penicillin-binding protein 5/6)